MGFVLGNNKNVNFPFEKKMATAVLKMAVLLERECVSCVFKASQCGFINDALYTVFTPHICKTFS